MPRTGTGIIMVAETIIMVTVATPLLRRSSAGSSALGVGAAKHQFCSILLET
jgi:hypothetical protein